MELKKGNSVEFRPIKQDCPNEFDLALLYCLLSEREPHQNISHKRMPTYTEHENFVMSKPYAYWFLIVVDCTVVGAIYLTMTWEIGIGIFKKHRRRGYGKRAVKMVMDQYPGKVFANIAPDNLISLNMFTDLGFKKAQVTLCHE